MVIFHSYVNLPEGSRWPWEKKGLRGVAWTAAVRTGVLRYKMSPNLGHLQLKTYSLPIRTDWVSSHGSWLDKTKKKMDDDDEGHDDADADDDGDDE